MVIKRLNAYEVPGIVYLVYQGQRDDFTNMFSLSFGAPRRHTALLEGDKSDRCGTQVEASPRTALISVDV